MILREPCLPPGWYPRQKVMIEEFLEPYKESSPKAALAAVAPHAGWYYSGVVAAAAAASLDREADTVVIIGGHLPRGMPILLAPEDGVKTPLGTMKIDTELRDEFEKQVSSRPDKYSDNTVEVLLPMARYFFPEAALLWLRFPAEHSSFEAGKLLEKTAEALGRRVVVLASTDLTHYGANYGFSPRGKGKAALQWVKKVNDAAFIDAILEGDPSLVLKRAEEDYSACSAGAVLGALGFVSSLEKTAKLLDYKTSADAVLPDSDQGEEIPDEEIPDSFVGYAAVAFGSAL
jgi:AmmeMemoRadiSam system protein B